ncbi:MAG: hypothetical protein R3C19_17095 [Planctomycetaceae bacterium]
MIRTQIPQCLGVTLLMLLPAPAMAQTLQIFEAHGIPLDEAQSGVDFPADAGLPIGSELPETDLPPDAEAYDYGEELLRGPVHEAFAEQYNQEPVEGLIVDREPPPNVPEVPPELKPEGSNIEWISGYWFWDDDRDDFIWVSGVWRHIPPGQRWVPGYWAELDGKYQWVGGTWVSTSTPEIEYIAQAPPESLDLGPVGTAPSEEHFWIPGCWNWNQASYVWRPGYWSAGYSNWIWVPQRSLWTPRGYLICNGYWDYPIVSRGTLFAPFRFRRPAFVNVGFRYVPRISLLAGGLQAHFWVSPRRRHYLFGDYYAANYRRAGILPWHTVHQRTVIRVGSRGLRGYDPLFAHASRTYGQRGINLSQQIVNQYNIYSSRSDRRPPQTLHEQRRRNAAQVVARSPGSRGSRSDEFWNQGDRLAESIRDRARQTPTAFTRVSTDQLSRLRERALETPALARQRSEIETGGRERFSSSRSAAELRRSVESRAAESRVSAAQANSADGGSNRRRGTARTGDPASTTESSRSHGSLRSGEDLTARTSPRSEAVRDAVTGRREGNVRWRLPAAAASGDATPSRSARSVRELRGDATAGAAPSAIRSSERSASGQTNSSSGERSDLRSRMERATSDAGAAASALRRSVQARGPDASRTGPNSGPAAGAEQRTVRSAPQSSAEAPRVTPSTPATRSPVDRHGIASSESAQRGADTNSPLSRRRASAADGASLQRNRTSSGRPAATMQAGQAPVATRSKSPAVGRPNAASAVPGRTPRATAPVAGPSIPRSQPPASGPAIRTRAGGVGPGNVRRSGSGNANVGRSSAVGTPVTRAPATRAPATRAPVTRAPANRPPAVRSNAGRGGSGRGASGRGASGQSGRGRR